MKIIISETARISLIEIIDFLNAKWTAKEIAVLENDIKKFRQTMMDNIVKHPSLENFPDIKYTLIGRNQIKMMYEIKADEIVIKLFWHCRQNPVRLKYFLSK